MKRKILFVLGILVVFCANSLAGEQYATILKTTGVANVKQAGSASFSTPAKMSMGLMKGDAIRTEADGFVAIIFNNDKSLVKIRKNSEIEIKEDYAARTIKMTQGRVLVNVTPGVGSNYRIETATSVASVKGTKFWVFSDKAGDRFYGIDGTVQILNIITGIEAIMQAGQMIISTADGQVVSIPIEPQDMPQDEEEQKPAETPSQPGEQEESVTMPSDETTAEATPTEEPGTETKEPAGKKSGKPFGMGLGLGSVTIDGKIYNQIAFRPELKLGKLGVALDVAIYMDEQGNIRKEEWDEVTDYLDKVYYVRWAQQGDPFFARVGALDNVTLGYGILMNGYFNTTEYPQVRKVGVHTGMQFDKLGWEAFIANVKEITGPGLLAGRVTYKPLKRIPLTFGSTLLIDVNQYKGLKDTDGDYVPDAFDAFSTGKFTTPSYFPGFNGTSLVDNKNHNFGAGEIKLKGKSFSKDTDRDGIPDEIDYDVDGDGLTDNLPNMVTTLDDSMYQAPDPFSTKDKSKTLTAAAFDLGFPVLNMKFFKLTVYGQAATFISGKVKDYNSGTEFAPGWGIAAPGLKMNIFKIVNLTTEYRYAGKNFLYGFWDRAYDFERVAIRQDANRTLYPYTKDQMRLMNEAMQGVFGAIDVNILNYLILGSYYQHMFTSGNEVKSFMASASIPAGKIPKLANAIAFYQRNNDDNPFDFKHPSENTILGYKIGFELGGGAVISYVFQKTFRDSDGNGKIDPKTEAVNLTTIETGFSF
ncbi:MAG: FecR domain-containing protein [Candidatus Neomarinimicrobiota bacterium]